jgi:hypothetical protein
VDTNKKKATAKARVSFKDLDPKKNPKGGSGIQSQLKNPSLPSQIQLKGNFLNPQPLPP